MNGRLLEGLFSEYAKSIGTEIAATGVEAGGYIFLSIQDERAMKVAPRKRGLRYVDYPDRARHLRIDAPLIACLTQTEGGPILVDVPVNRASPEVPPQLATLTVKVSPVDGDGKTLVAVPTAAGNLDYDFHGYVGLEDLLGVARDALLLAEASGDMDCQGAHDVPYVGRPPAPDRQAINVMALKYKVCDACLEAMADMGFPMAPPIPEGWE